MSQLLKLDAPNIHDSRTAKPGEAHKRIELARWLSDWHLIAFLGTTQLISDVSIPCLRNQVMLMALDTVGGPQVDYADCDKSKDF